MWKLNSAATGETVYSGNVQPVYQGGLWRVPAANFEDESRENYEAVFQPEPVALPVLSPVAFKMCFTAAERIALKALRGTDPVLEDWMSILDDPRLTGVDLNLASTQAAIDYLVGKVAGFDPDRAAQVKAGQVL